MTKSTDSGFAGSPFFQFHGFLVICFPYVSFLLTIFHEPSLTTFYCISPLRVKLQFLGFQNLSLNGCTKKIYMPPAVGWRGSWISSQGIGSMGAFWCSLQGYCLAVAVCFNCAATGKQRSWIGCQFACDLMVGRAISVHSRQRWKRGQPRRQFRYSILSHSVIEWKFQITVALQFQHHRRVLGHT